MNNVFTKKGNKTEVYANGQTLLIDTQDLQRLQDVVRNVTISDKDGSPIILKESGAIVPLIIFLFNPNKSESVQQITKGNDYRKKNVKLIGGE